MKDRKTKLLSSYWLDCVLNVNKIQSLYETLYLVVLLVK